MQFDCSNRTTAGLINRTSILIHPHSQPECSVFRRFSGPKLIGPDVRWYDDTLVRKLFLPYFFFMSHCLGLIGIYQREGNILESTQSGYKSTTEKLRQIQNKLPDVLVNFTTSHNTLRVEFHLQTSVKKIKYAIYCSFLVLLACHSTIIMHYYINIPITQTFKQVKNLSLNDLKTLTKM